MTIMVRAPARPGTKCNYRHRPAKLKPRSPDVAPTRVRPDNPTGTGARPAFQPRLVLAIRDLRAFGPQPLRERRSSVRTASPHQPRHRPAFQSAIADHQS